MDPRSPALAAEVLKLVHSSRLNLSNEKATQQQLAEVLTQSGIQYEREVRLSDGDRVDFMIGDEIAVELKIKARRLEIFRQLERYCQHDRVHIIMLLTATSMGLPREINGRPALVGSLGRGWL